MKKSILIRANGFYLVEWDQQTGNQVAQVQIKHQLARHLGAYAEFDETATVGTFIYLLNDFVDEVEYIFNYYLNGVDFYDFLQESLAEPITHQDLDFVDLAWNIRLIVSTDMTVLDLIPTLIGVKEIEGSSLDEIHDLDFIRLRDFCQFKLCAATALDVPDPHTHEISVEAEKRWTLFEIISGFLGEISKYGTPLQKLEVINDLNSASKISFTDLLEYLEEMEEVTTEGKPGLSGDDLDDEDDDE